MNYLAVGVASFVGVSGAVVQLAHDNVAVPDDLAGWSITAICFAIILYFFRRDQNRTKELETKISALETQLTALVAQNTTLQTDLQVALTKLEILRTRNEELENELDDLA